jgi:hypothetical protein
MDTTNLADFLISASMQSVVGMPLGDVLGFYLDVVLASGDASVRLTGAASDLPDRTEAFLLTASNFTSSDRWTGPDGKPVWNAQDLLEIGDGQGIGGIWLAPRAVRYFFDPDDRRRGLATQGPFDSAAAIEFRGERSHGADRLVLYATAEYPCAVELITAAERCDSVLASLREFVPQTLATTLVEGRCCT